MKQENKYRLATAGILLIALAAALAISMQRLKESRRIQPVPILMYHKIGAVTNNAWWVPTEIFERHLRDLRDQGYTAILPDDLVCHRKAGQRLPAKPVVITFDDGYSASLALAEPLLKKYGFRAVVYLITGLTAETPDDRLQYEGLDVLTWPEIRAMQSRGTFVFGGHSHRHPNLAGMQDPYPEINECYRQLKEHGIKPPYSFCYPYGQYNTNTIEAVKRAGFQSAMVCKDEVAMTGTAMNLLALPRVSVMGGTHAFQVRRLPAPDTPGEIVLEVTHAGIPMAVSPRLVRSGARDDEGWLAPVEIENGHYQWRWPETGTSQVPLRLEIRDKHRLFPMFSCEL